MTGPAASSGSGNARRAARVIDALRRGWAVSISGPDGAVHLIPVETSIDAPGEARQFLISAARAQTLKLANQKDAAAPDRPVRMISGEHVPVPIARAIADPAMDMEYPMKGPFRAQPLDAAIAAQAAMDLARIAGILPAYYWLDTEADDATSCSTADLAAFSDEGRLNLVARTRLPVEAMEQSEIAVFRSPEDLREHAALIIGRQQSGPPLVRLHSECLTGDVLGSLKCDCGPQLQGALHAMAHAAADAPDGADWGILLYLRQEGRGIGLINKLRAYQLQDQGFDTVDANNRLGFPTEARDFGVAAAMLRALGVSSVRLMTNNPEKVAALAASGIVVTERVPLKITANRHNAHYLDTKRDRTGHKL